MLVRAVVAAREASTFIHLIRHPLRVTEVWSHDANVTMATEVAWREIFSLSAQPNEAKYSHRRKSFLLGSI